MPEFTLPRFAEGDTDYIAELNTSAAASEDAVEPSVTDIDAIGGTLTLDYDATLVYRVTATADTTIAINGWPASGTAASMEIIAVDWGAYAMTLPSSWYWGSAGVPAFPASGRARLILRSDDAGSTVDAMLAWSA